MVNYVAVNWIGYPAFGQSSAQMPDKMERAIITPLMS